MITILKYKYYILGILILVGVGYFAISNQSVQLKDNPTFNEIVKADKCSSQITTNPYINSQIHWKAMMSGNANTDGIRFLVIDDQHPVGQQDKHGLFWGTFLVSATDPRYNKDGSFNQTGLKDWAEKWNSNWVNYILDVYGNTKEVTGSEEYWVTATIDGVDCDPKEGYDGGYIEMSVVKIEKI